MALSASRELIKESMNVNTPTPDPTDLSDQTPRRYMGRPQDAADAGAEVLTEGFGKLAQVWLHIPPNTQSLMLVEDLGQAGGKELTAVQRADIERVGWCEQVAYHAGYDQYWKMPTFGAILNMPKHYKIPMPPANQVKVVSKLVKASDPKGFWMFVRLRGSEELGQG